MTGGGFLSRLKEAVQKTKENFVGRLEEAMGLRPEMDGALLEDLESILIGADVGVDTASDLIEKIRDQADRKMVRDAEQVKRLIQTTLVEILNQSSRNGEAARAGQSVPRVVFVVGVNGVGKTTTIGKLAYLYRNLGKKPLICASDTFRAAAIDQLEIWARRTSTEIIKQASGADPAAVLFDALQAARARGRDPVIVDTAGRLHTKSNLMQELEKMRRVAAREVEGAPHEVLLILDATVGQNGLVQAREFTRATGVTGIIVTKLDGTAKGGIVVAIARDLKIPIRYVGTGEALEDLVEFRAQDFVESLFGA